MQTWPLQAAQARLAEIVKRAESEGPQAIAVDGRSVAVLLSRSDFDRLSGRQVSLLDFMQASPLVGLEQELPLERTP